MHVHFASRVKENFNKKDNVYAPVVISWIETILGLLII